MDGRPRKSVLIPDSGNFYSSSKSPVSGANIPAIQWVPRILCVGVKRPGSENDHSTRIRTLIT
jgi:hypothetical protein